MDMTMDIMPILIALGVVAGVGLILGIVLALASKFFAVDEDEKVSLVREALPGANCGACGYTGCDGYAEAVAKGEAEPNLCIPGGSSTAAQLSIILGVKIQELEPKVAFVACGGDCENASSCAVYEGIKSCKAASLVYGGPFDCAYSCVGCGDCATVCPVDAICVHDGLAHIDPRVCVGCGKCVGTCPKHIIKLLPKEAKTAVMCSNVQKGALARTNCKNACIGCKKCELNCPEKAITVIDNLARIDYDKCTGCRLCEENCPTKCLKPIDFKNNMIG
jgi:Na+-translocating ferredoxin:NAD+ oxidoreductase RNF subunit RnfB